jgi:hypothetical protein
MLLSITGAKGKYLFLLVIPRTIACLRVAACGANRVRTSRGVKVLELARISTAMMATASLHPKRHMRHGIE